MSKNPPTPPKQTDKAKRESPQDFMLAFLAWCQKNPERKLTPKGFAIIRGEQQDKPK